MDMFSNEGSMKKPILKELAKPLIKFIKFKGYDPTDSRALNRAGAPGAGIN